MVTARSPDVRRPPDDPLAPLLMAGLFVRSPIRHRNQRLGAMLICGFAVSGSHRQTLMANDVAHFGGALSPNPGSSVGRPTDRRKLRCHNAYSDLGDRFQLEAQVEPRGGWPRARGHSLVPLARFLREVAFGTEETAAIAGAYEAALLELDLTRTSPGAETLAKSIIGIATQGERDPNRLRERAIETISGLPAPCFAQSGNSRSSKRVKEAPPKRG